jgi:hypothetical protein
VHDTAAADGFRLHVVLGEEPKCECGREDIHRRFDLVLRDAEKAPLIFGVNRQFLLDALSGMEDNEVLFYYAGPKTGIVLQDRWQKHAAIIMPMHTWRCDTKLGLPVFVQKPTEDELREAATWQQALSLPAEAE